MKKLLNKKVKTLAKTLNMDAETLLDKIVKEYEDKYTTKIMISALITSWVDRGKATATANEDDDFPLVHVHSDKTFAFITELQMIADTEYFLFTDYICTVFIEGDMKISIRQE